MSFLLPILLHAIAWVVDRPAVNPNIIRSEIMIPMRDGTHLSAIEYVPEAPGPHPAIIYRTPYGKNEYDGYAEFPLKAAKKGYLVYLVDVRGRFQSEGNFIAYHQERNDGYDLVEWVGHNKNCNGKIGTYGGSYPGFVQWLTIDEAPPSLKAAAPEMTPVSSHHFFYYGGAFSSTWLDWFIPYILPDKRRRADDRTGTWDEALAEQEWQSIRDHWYRHRPLDQNPLLEQYAPEYFEWLRHPDSSAWWNFASAEKALGTMEVPVFLLSGWYDAAYGPEGAIRAFKKIQQSNKHPVVKENSKIIIGPWNHTSINVLKNEFGEISFGASAGIDYDTWLLNWFDQVLKNTNSGEIPPVQLFVMGENRWHFFDQWPETKDLVLYLNRQDQMDGILSKINHAGIEKSQYTFNPLDPFFDKYYEKSVPYDQRPLEGRKDVLTFTSETLHESITVAGEIKAELFVSSSAIDTDFSITLCDVYPDGKSINLSTLDAGYLRMRYRNGFSKQEMMVPAEKYKIAIGKLYTANTFLPGHKIRLSITSSKFPHYDINTNTGLELASDSTLVRANQIIYHSEDFPSRLLLPVLK